MYLNGSQLGPISPTVPRPMKCIRDDVTWCNGIEMDHEITSSLIAARDATNRYQPFTRSITRVHKSCLLTYIRLMFSLVKRNADSSIAVVTEQT